MEAGSGNGICTSREVMGEGKNGELRIQDTISWDVVNLNCKGKEGIWTVDIRTRSSGGTNR